MTLQYRRREVFLQEAEGLYTGALVAPTGPGGEDVLGAQGHRVMDVLGPPYYGRLKAIEL